MLDRRSWQTVAQLDLANSVAHAATFWPEGDRCVLSGVGVRGLDLASRRLLLRLQAAFGLGSSIVASDDGSALFQGRGTQISVWRVPSWEEIRRAEAELRISESFPPESGGQGADDSPRPD